MTVAPLRIVIAKPDSGVIGGFERVLSRVTGWLRSRGHLVRVLTIRTDIPIEGSVHLVPSKALERAAPTYLAHISQLAAFRRLDLGPADLAISTQPPSQGIRHVRHLALFYHHDRYFYDLSERVAQAGLVGDPELHRELSSLVRAADRPGMDGVTQFAVPSKSVRDRLRRFDGVQRVVPFHAGLGYSLASAPIQPAESKTHVLCVSRHEFPKRTELFVAAAHQTPELTSVCVGAGSLLSHAQRLDRHLDGGATIDAEELWSRPPTGRLPRLAQEGSGRVRFLTHVLGSELAALYRDAHCVVAPAFEEDYGLTAIEAMAWRTPVVVCDDGGSLAEIVTETGGGLVVRPNHDAIAEAVRRIAYDRRLADRLGAAGQDAIRYRFTWPRAFEQLDAAISRVMGAN